MKRPAGVGSIRSRPKSGVMPGSGSCRFCSSRQLLYTTNLIELLNAELRNATRNRGQFLNDTAALKRLWLMICNIEDKRAAQRAKQSETRNRMQRLY